MNTLFPISARRWLGLLERIERWLDRATPARGLPLQTLSHSRAFRWRRLNPLEGVIEVVSTPAMCNPDDLLGIDRAKDVLLRNTAQFAAGLPANNALLWGARGTGKSTLVKAAATQLANQGLKLVEILKEDLDQLPQLMAQLRPLPARFLLYCDDLSFEEDDVSYKALKAALEGGVEARPENVLFYATSNRRHLMPRRFSVDAPGDDGQLHPEETVEERISLSDRFGLWLGFHPMDQNDYLAIVRHQAQKLQLSLEISELERRALLWARTRGARSGRVAQQFITDLTGQLATGSISPENTEP
ncbi:ATP-binding protein [Magnetofaba australis]|uniref:Putative ATPase n=1 Tax=Magnetofaba australis IT-1 TaxID=1434232 RepID=A0A1Y2K597_9PROT|nr:ATP-binding protein [Magnetofaba australis]OSM04809.1 putative ATPase [Magnetofaba australis IT-1]